MSDIEIDLPGIYSSRDLSQKAGGTRHPTGCGCRYSDAWRCAVDSRLTRQIACTCQCHRYIQEGVTWAQAKINAAKL